jgi:hypothetical protein
MEKHGTASWQDSIAAHENEALEALLVIGSSAKSTFVSTAYMLYPALVKPPLYPSHLQAILLPRPSLWSSRW